MTEKCVLNSQYYEIIDMLLLHNNAKSNIVK